MRQSFGPWATQINVGPRPGLDTFWKRRFDMLASTHRSRPTLSRRAITLLAAVAVATCTVPTLLVAPAATEEPAARQTTPVATAARAVPSDAVPAAENSLPREQLRYAGKSFDEWNKTLAVNLDAQTRCEAIEALGVFGANGYAEEATRAIIFALQRKSVPATVAYGQGNVRYVNTEAREAIDLIGPYAVPALVDLLGNDNPSVRAEAAQQLQWSSHWKVADVAKTASRALVEAARDDSADVRRRACLALARCLSAEAGKDLVAPAVTALVAALKDNDVEVRQSAVSSLQALGPAEASRETLDTAVAPLAAALRDNDQTVREGAALALGGIAATDHGRGAVAVAVAPLIAALGDDVETVAASAAWALGQIGPDAAAAVPALIEVVKTGDRDRARDAYYNFGMGSRGSTAFPQSMRSYENSVVQAVGALERIGPAAKEAIPAIDQLITELESSQMRGGRYGGPVIEAWQLPLRDAIQNIRGEAPATSETPDGSR